MSRGHQIMGRSLGEGFFFITNLGCSSIVNFAACISEDMGQSFFEIEEIREGCLYGGDYEGV